MDEAAFLEPGSECRIITIAVDPDPAHDVKMPYTTRKTIRPVKVAAYYLYEGDTWTVDRVIAHGPTVLKSGNVGQGMGETYWQLKPWGGGDWWPEPGPPPWLVEIVSSHMPTTAPEWTEGGEAA